MYGDFTSQWFRRLETAKVSLFWEPTTKQQLWSCVRGAEHCARRSGVTRYSIVSNGWTKAVLARQVEIQMRGMQRVPPRQAENRLRRVHPLATRQGERRLRGVQSGTRRSSEFEADQAREGEFAGNQTRTRNQTRARDRARTGAVNHSRILQL